MLIQTRQIPLILKNAKARQLPEQDSAEMFEKSKTKRYNLPFQNLKIKSVFAGANMALTIHKTNRERAYPFFNQEIAAPEIIIIIHPSDRLHHNPAWLSPACMRSRRSLIIKKPVRLYEGADKPRNHAEPEERTERLSLPTPLFLVVVAATIRDAVGSEVILV